MRLLITGGAGFIGSNFARYWSVRHAGDALVVLDVLTYAGNRENLADLEGDGRVVFVHGDIADGALVAETIGSHRIDTIVNFAAVERYGIKAEGSATAADPKVLSELAGLVAADRLEVPIASTYPLGEVREAYRQLESGHGRGKIVLLT